MLLLLLELPQEQLVMQQQVLEQQQVLQQTQLVLVQLVQLVQQEQPKVLLVVAEDREADRGDRAG